MGVRRHKGEVSASNTIYFLQSKDALLFIHVWRPHNFDFYGKNHTVGQGIPEFSHCELLVFWL
jgi:hypothetical protein